MAVRLRLRRMGRKKLPLWTIVAADSRRARDGRYIEKLGNYNPLVKPSTVDLNVERIHYWLAQGAQPSDTVRNLLSREGILLERSLRLKGKSEAEILQAVTEHRERHAAKRAASAKETPQSRRQKALDEEKKHVAKQEADTAKRRAEEQEKARLEAEAAKKKLAQERAEAEKAAAEAAEKEQTAASSAEAEPVDSADATPAAKADSTKEETPEATAEAPAAAASAEAEPVDAADATPAEKADSTEEEASATTSAEDDTPEEEKKPEK